MTLRPDIKPLQTERLTLRLPREDDFPAMLAFNDSPRAAILGAPLDRQTLWRGLMANVGVWALRGYGFWSVETKAGDFVGRVGVICPDGWPEPELAWHLYDGYEGKGFAAEAARAAKADYHARISRAPLISIIVHANTRSQALATRLGAMVEAEWELMGKACQIWRHPASGAIA